MRRLHAVIFERAILFSVPSERCGAIKPNTILPVHGEDSPSPSCDFAAPEGIWREDLRMRFMIGRDGDRAWQRREKRIDEDKFIVLAEWWRHRTNAR
jgi:hypothetical protein